MDDTPANLCLNHPEILRKLATVNVFDLEPGESAESAKIKQFCIAQSIMTFER